nr:CMRF35-like molecule 1 isoform X10 [Equus caballus]
MHLLLFFLLLFGLSGSFDIRGPKVMRGPERGSLTVRCCYGQGWKTYRKWWCRGADWASCKILVITTGSEQEVKQDRVSIRDDQRNLTFTVTMEELRRDDEDTYWCGIKRTGTDPGFQVKVTIDPAPTTVSTTTTMSTAPVTPEKIQVSPTVTSHHSESRSGRPQAGNHEPAGQKVKSSVSLKLSVLIPLIFAVLLLLSVAASLLAWRMVKQREKGSKREQEGVEGSQKETRTSEHLKAGPRCALPALVLHWEGSLEQSYLHRQLSLIVSSCARHSWH